MRRSVRLRKRTRAIVQVDVECVDDFGGWTRLKLGKGQLLLGECVI